MVNRIIDFLLFSTIFICSIVFFKSPFEGYYYYFVALFFLPIFIYKFGIPKLPVKVLFLPIVISLYHVLIGNNTVFLFLKIGCGFVFLLLFYYLMIKFYDFDVIKIFNAYLNWVKVIMVLGGVQIVSSVVGFESGYNFNWIFNKWTLAQGSLGIVRVNSIFSEPSQYGITMAPAVLIAIFGLLGVFYKEVKLSRFYSILLIVTFVLTVSSLAFFGLLLCVILFFIYKRKFTYLIIMLVVFPSLMYVIYNNISEVRSRSKAFYNLAFESDFSIENVNTSSFVLYNNYNVAVSNFLDHPLGTGLGSHDLAFEKYSLTRTMNIFELDFNQVDANSTFLRLMSELGILGVGFILYVLFKFYIPLSKDNVYSLISNALLVLLILHLVRQGNYFYNGFPFFVFLYYFTWKEHEETLLENLEVRQIEE